MKQLNPDDAGARLQTQHYAYIINNEPDIDWFEATTENHIGEGEAPFLSLDKIRQNYPLSFHGAGMSLGSYQPLNINYIRTLKYIIERYQPLHISDHLSWTSFQRHYNHKLLPFPFNNSNLQAIADKISTAQDFLGQEILIENPSTHMHFTSSHIHESEFTNRLLQKTGCKLLLNIDNLITCSESSGTDADEYIQSISRDMIAEIHLQGQQMDNNYTENMNDSSAWQLYKRTIELTAPLPTLIKGSPETESFNSLEKQVSKVKKFIKPFSTGSISGIAINQ